MCKPQKKFILWLLITWVLLPVRHNFLNLFRYGNGEYCEKSIRQQFGSKIPFASWFMEVSKDLKGKELVAALDPSHISKSGKHTFR